MSFDPASLMLSEQAKRQIKEWLDSKGVGQQCRACTSGQYQVLNAALGIPLAAPDGAIELTLNVGVVPIRCTHCAHVMFFDARYMQLSKT